MKKKFTIITPTLNNELTIKRTILSIHNQSYSNFEHIIVDGGSNDKTTEIIRNFQKYYKIKYFKQKKRGIYDAINIGIKKSQGRFISILNADDFYAHKNVLKFVVNHFLKNSESRILISNVKIINKKKKLYRIYKSDYFIKSFFYLGLMPPHPGIFIEKIIYKKYGLFNTNFITAGDFEFLLRVILKNKISFTKLRKTTVIMLSGGKSNDGLKSFVQNTIEIKKSFIVNNIFSSFFLILLRVPVKLFQIILAKIT